MARIAVSTKLLEYKLHGGNLYSLSPWNNVPFIIQKIGSSETGLMDSCPQTQDTKSARVELVYPDYKSSALTTKLLLKLLYVSNCQNKALSNPFGPLLYQLSYSRMKSGRWESNPRHMVLLLYVPFSCL